MPPKNKERIAAVIVTRDRLSLLKKVIQALGEQSFPVTEIIIIDNSSQSSTYDYLKTLKNVHCMKTNQNIGGAGGFHVGMKIALSLDIDFIWLMDDDAIPKKDTLEKLLRAYRYLKPKKRIIGFLASLVVWSDGRVHKMNPCVPQKYDWATDFSKDYPYVKIKSASFVSFLVPVYIVKKLGLPVFDFFIWADDVEFSSRISKKYFSYCVLDSVVVHQTEKNRGADPRYISAENIQKYQYGIRNQIWILKKSGKFGLLRGFLFLATYYFLMRREKIKLSFCLKIMWTGFTGFFMFFKKEAITDEKLKSLVEFSNIELDGSKP